jgi:NitT/TauT family transport system substrate-binding protein
MTRPTTGPRAPSRRWWITLLAAFALVAAACGGDDDDASESGSDGEAAGDLTPVSLQLQWLPQSQFAGYFAALEEGYYEEAGLDVEILDGGVDIVPQQVLDSGQADFAIAWVPKALASRAEGMEIVDIAQIFQRSATLQVSWKDSEIADPADMAGTTVGNWGFGNEFELLAGLREAGLDPDGDVEMVQQNFDMEALINREIDSAQAMIYNEYGQLLDATDPESGEQLQADQFNVIDWNDVGTAMLQDALWARADWLADEANAETAQAFVTASLKGWIFCRDNPDECVQHVLAAGTALDELHMTYMMNEINPLIWPSPDGIGQIDADLWQQTIDISIESELIPEDPGEEVYDMTYVEAALAELEDEGLDPVGSDFTEIDTDLSAAGG